jgi:hypothetical protein
MNKLAFVPMLVLLAALLAWAWSANAATTSRMSMMYNFLGGDDGARVFGNLTWFNGKIYGATSYGGVGCPAAACGVVAQLTPPANSGEAWTETTIHFFNGVGVDGSHPYSGLTVGRSGGVLYGTTLDGAGGCPNHGCGSVYQLLPPLPNQTAWRETILHNFAAANDGTIPSAGVIQDQTGALYGVTTHGGNAGCGGEGCGVVYRLARPQSGQTAWTETILYRFKGGADGYYPVGGLMLDGKGGLYGTTFWGGVGCAGYGCGVVFHVSPPKTGPADWTYEIIHKFTGAVDGSAPSAMLSGDGKGHLFGTTTGGGGKGCPDTEGCGTIFELLPPTNTNPKWGLVSVYRFHGGTDGASPYSGLTFASNGLAIYGTTVAGGTGNPAGNTCAPFNGCGTIYRLHHSASSGWQENVLFRFQNSGIGANPYGGVILDSGETTLYGATARLGYRGSNPCGGNGCGRAFAFQLQ